MRMRQDDGIINNNPPGTNLGNIGAFCTSSCSLKDGNLEEDEDLPIRYIQVVPGTRATVSHKTQLGPSSLLMDRCGWSWDFALVAIVSRLWAEEIFQCFHGGRVGGPGLVPVPVTDPEAAGH
jgi:hypothetical protein